MMKHSIRILLVLFSCYSVQLNAQSMTWAEISDKMDALGDKMDALGAQMDEYGKQMDEYGKQMDKNPEDKSLSKKMGELGDKMGDLGGKMGEYGSEMGDYGTQIGKKHQKMQNWLFKQLQKDGLINSFKGKVVIEANDEGMTVNGSKLTEQQFATYRAGFEKHWGRALKTGFRYKFNGTVKETDGEFETSGNNSSDF